MKICFLGMGSIGTRHYKILERNYNFDVYHHKQIGNRKYDVAFITNPTFLHIETAIKAVQDGAKYLFIEKPVDCKLDRLDELLSLVDKNKVTAYVAYPFRHHHKIQELKKSYKDQWLYFVCHTDFEKWRPYKTYSHGKEQGGGCLLELSHEVDLAQYLLGPVKSIINSLPTIFDATLDLDTECWLRVEHCNKNLSYHNLNIKQPVEHTL
jgi:predicted dehydrogenase